MALKRPTGDALAEALRERIGYDFRDHQLLQTALTHSSAVKATTNNERLEFLGDRVLGLVVAEMLFRLFPDCARRRPCAALQCPGRRANAAGRSGWNSVSTC